MAHAGRQQWDGCVVAHITDVQCRRRCNGEPGTSPPPTKPTAHNSHPTLPQEKTNHAPPADPETPEAHDSSKNFLFSTSSVLNLRLKVHFDPGSTVQNSLGLGTLKAGNWFCWLCHFLDHLQEWDPTTFFFFFFSAIYYEHIGEGEKWEESIYLLTTLTCLF